MRIAVLKETYPGERRVSLVPANVHGIVKAGGEVFVESGAGESAGFLDAAYAEKGAEVVGDRSALFDADMLLQVRTVGANPVMGAEHDLPHLRSGQYVIGMADPLGNPAIAQRFAATGATLFALELIPRITRAQSMDILSSQATIAGYRAVLLAAIELPSMFPMMMTAAGTLTAARVFVIGVGVAGLQAIATARKLGAIVHAYDVRPACREQVESLGGKFVQVQLDAASSEDKGGYAKAMDEDFYRRQRELMAQVVAESDVVITTAAIPGRPSPLLVTADAVRGMRLGSVIIDLAAERGGNCELTQADQRVVKHGVTILGPTNLPADTPNHASQMFGNNVVKFVLNMMKKGQFQLNLEDEIVRETLVAHQGQIALARVRDLVSAGK
ncbi:MAG TPA: Re/Si-specific NAD(P)(+) transhydrogenase subunit alpha [Planctomycetaceae bacterium]|nr:Re/Si-specific NAD(P)(+) transhydrogenase subunit alpha [Planctomycetaceae bacterium]